MTQNRLKLVQTGFLSYRLSSSELVVTLVILLDIFLRPFLSFEQLQELKIKLKNGNLKTDFEKQAFLKFTEALV